MTARSILPLGVAAAPAAPVLHARAIEPSLSVEAGIVSELIDAGESLSNRPAGFLSIEAEADGLFLGTGLRSLRVKYDRFAANLFGGFRYGFGPAEAEIGVERAWRNRSNRDHTAIFAGLAVQPLDTLELFAGASYAPRPSGWTDLSAGAAREVVDHWTVSGTLGRNPLDRITYGDIGVDDAMTDAITLDLRYHRSMEISNRVVLGVAFSSGVP